MGILNAFTPSLYTLLVAMVFPFVFFAYHVSYWNRPQTLKILDLAFTLLCITAACIVIGKVAFRNPQWSSEYSLLIFMHVIPLILTLLIITTFRQVGIKLSVGTSASSGEKRTPIDSRGTIERMSWDDVVIDPGLKEEMQSVVALLREPHTARKYGIESPKGILLYGPPGTGKTSIARVIASTAQFSFFVLKLDEVISKWVGESEKNLTALFESAQAKAPAVIFIDEVDSIGRARSSGNAQHADTLLNHLLQLIDGVIKREGLYIIAATNRPDCVDPALLRAGRINRLIEVPLPSFAARKDLFSLYLSKLHIEDDLSLDGLAKLTEGRSPADIREICNRAGLNAFKRERTAGTRQYTVTFADLEQALRECL